MFEMKLKRWKSLKRHCYAIGLFLLLANIVMAQSSGPAWIKQKLTSNGVFKNPEYQFTDVYDDYKSNENIKGVFINGLDYLGKPTKFFAWYGVPKGMEAGQKAPAVVCVHGGGGTAFEAWVKQWNDRGYIAISMSLEGNVPGPKDENNQKPRFEFSGPQRDGFFKDVDKDLHDQWFYHAVADVILANSLLRDQKFSTQIDTTQIGITGISWGGILTNVITGIDNRWAFSIPIYGCGYLHETPQYSNQLSQQAIEKQEFYLKNWEPSLYLPLQSQPTLHVNGTNDGHFSMNSFTKTYWASPKEKYLRVEHNMRHGHGAGWRPIDSYQFADYITKSDTQRLTFGDNSLEANGRLSYSYNYAGSLDAAYLYYTTDTADWSGKGYEWLEKEATISAGERTISAALPEGALAYFINAINAEGLIFSSPMAIGKAEIGRRVNQNTKK